MFFSLVEAFAAIVSLKCSVFASRGQQATERKAS